jgi:hypothetical protein
MQHCERQSGDDEREGIEQERLPRPERRHDPAAERRPEQHEAEGPDELVESVGLQKELARDDLRDDRRERRAEERLACPEDGRHDDEVPELHHAGDGEGADDSDGEGPHEVGCDHDPSALDAIRDDAAQQDEERQGQGPRDADDGERGGRTREVVDLPGQGYEIDPVPHERDRHSRPEECEVPDPQHRGDPEGSAACQVPRPPKTANGFSGATSQTRPPPGST